MSTDIPSSESRSIEHPLDESLYSLDSDSLKFFKAQTGIDDEDALKQHILTVQAKAYAVYPYTCIRTFRFTNLKISRLPAYGHVLKLGRERKGAILLDIGCCFGNDVRKAVYDGFPVENVIASDLRDDFWKIGIELFRHDAERNSIPFVQGDAFDPSFIAPASPAHEVPDTPNPTLSSLTTLTPLQGRISAIHASSFFHLFDEEQQLRLAHTLASLLSPAPGSVIFGSHSARRDRKQELTRYRHTPESWKALWDGVVFKKDMVRVDARLKLADKTDFSGIEPGLEIHLLVWSVTRL